MIRLYTFSNGTLQAGIFPTDGRLPPETVWIDLIEPSREEERAVEQALNIDAPTREEMQEIELSSRIYLEGDAAYMTALVLYKSETSEPDTTAITFIRTATALVTLRYAEPQAFRSYALRAPRQPAICSSPDLDLSQDALLVDPLGEEDVPGAQRHDRQDDQDAARNDRAGRPDVAQAVRRGRVGGGGSGSGSCCGSVTTFSRGGVRRCGGRGGSGISRRRSRSSSGIGRCGSRRCSVILGRSRSNNAQASHEDDGGCDRQSLEVHFFTP